MGDITIKVELHLNVHFETLKADPTLILKKFPQVESIAAVSPTMYFITTKPLKLTHSIWVRRRWAVNIATTEDRVVWLPDDDGIPDQGSDGWIEGYVESAGPGKSYVCLNMIQSHRLLNFMTISLFKNNIDRLARETVKEFEQNFNDQSYWNDVPTYAGS